MNSTGICSRSERIDGVVRQGSDSDAPAVKREEEEDCGKGRAVSALTEKLKREPELSRDEAMLFVKTETNAPGVCFRSIVWPQARKLARLPAQKRGRPTKRAPESAPK